MSVISSTSRAVLPLPPAQRQEAGQVAVRIASEIGRLIAALPEHARGASGMARLTGVPRVTCQRVVQAVQDGDPSPMMLARLPGIEGLKQFVDGLARAGAAPQDVTAAGAAIEALERLIALAGGSHSKLAERLMAMPSDENTGATLGTVEQRHELFRAAYSVTGRRCRTAFSIYAFRPRPGDPSVLERVLVKGLIGCVSAPGGMPFTLSSGNTRSEGPTEPAALDRGTPIRENAPEAILRPFTTDPLPSITARGSGGNVFHVVEARGGFGEPFDAVTALRGSAPMIDPASQKPTLSSVWSLVSCPSENLVLDVYLHQSIERRFRPGLDCLLWTADLDIPPERRWNMRVPNAPRLELLGPGTDRSRTDCYARHTEVSRYLFEHAGWQEGEFIGFRCEVRFPVWRAGYCMTFDPPAQTAEGNEEA